MERCRLRLRQLLDERTPAGRLRQKTFAKHMGHSEAWLSNVLNGTRGLRIVDLDKVADFFRIPVSELIRETDADLMEVTATERKLIRKVRRVSEEYRVTIYTLAGMTELVNPRLEPKHPPKRGRRKPPNPDA